MLADLAGGHADRTWGARICDYTRPAVLILDNFALRAHTAAQADDLYELIAKRAILHRPLIPTFNRWTVDWYPLFPNPIVAGSVVDRLINTSYQVLMAACPTAPANDPGTATRLHPPPSSRANHAELHLGNCVTRTPGGLREQ